MDVFTVTLLPAYEGDCLWIEYGDAAQPRRVLVDAGRKGTYKRLKKKFEALPAAQRTFELLVITHVDRDHIEGVLDVLGDSDQPVKFKDIWFNGYKHLEEATGNTMGPVQGEVLTALLERPGSPWNEAFAKKPICLEDAKPLPSVTLPGGLKLTLLSPTIPKLQKMLVEWERACRKEGLVPGAGVVLDAPEDEIFGPPNVDVAASEPFEADEAEANGSSIALLAEFGGKRILLGADAHPDVLAEALGRLSPGGKVKLDAYKVSHHGSAHNTSKEMLDLIDCKTYLFSTNGSYFNHPTPSAVARVIKFGKAKTLIFNYRSDETKPWDAAGLKATWKYEAHYPIAELPGEIGVTLLG
jgi:hypothetical protein